MTCFVKIVLLISLTFVTGKALCGPNDLRALRHLALALTDQPPSTADAQQIFGEQLTLEEAREVMLSSEAHKNKVRRIFNDMFGVGPDVFISDEAFRLRRDQEGTPYYAQGKSTCDPSEATVVTPWFLDAPDTILVCNNSLSNQIRLPDGNGEIWCLDRDTFVNNSSCGCGPDLILCLDDQTESQLRDDIRNEFAERGLYAYENNLSWFDLLGADFFYGRRGLFWFYNFNQGISQKIDATIESADLIALRQIPTSSPAVAPHLAKAFLRAGVATSPGFLKQNNNFRSRIRSLVNSLLCKDVDGSLNIDNYDQFLNSDFSDFDRAHGDQEGCASCHYPMDNMGSALFGWDDQGYYRYIWDHNGVRGFDKTSHVFGEDGVGEGFLMQGFIERGPEFSSCMAQTAWEQIAGIGWTEVGSELRLNLTTAVSSGPRSLLRAIFNSEQLLRIRAVGTPNGVNASNSGGQLDFTADILPILQASCFGSACHSNATSLGTGYDFSVPEIFTSAPHGRLTDGSMPPASSGKTISKGNQDLLLQYLSQ